MDVIQIASYIDHTLLKPDATEMQIKQLCEEAKEHGFFSVCINPYWVPLAKELLRESSVQVCTVVAFPLGAMSKEMKANEAKESRLYGADEIDMVMNIALAKKGKWQELQEEIEAVVIASKQCCVKVIIETCLLGEEEIILASKTIEKAGAQFVKTSTGFGAHGAKISDIHLIKAAISSDIKIKASGGIKDKKTLMSMLHAGASRIGCSASIGILDELN